LVIVGVLLLEQSEGFLGGKLGNTGEVLDAKSVENFGAAKFACATAQRAFNFL
jgi:hypothetical protein